MLGKCDLLHGIEVSRFAYSCSFFELLFQFLSMRQAICDLGVMSFDFSSVSTFPPPDCLYLSEEVRKSCENRPRIWHIFCFRWHSNSHQSVFLVLHPNRYELTWWHQYNSLIPSTSFVSSVWNSSLSAWYSPLSLSLSPYSGFPSQSGLLKFIVSHWKFAPPFATRNTNSSSLRVIRTSFVFSLLKCFLDALIPCFIDHLFSIFQNQWSECLLCKFPPRKSLAKKIHHNISSKSMKSCFVSLGVSGDIQLMHQVVQLALWMIQQTSIHFEISRLPGGLGHLADSNSIP